MLPWLLLLPLLGGLLALVAGRIHPDAPRVLSLLVLAGSLALTVAIWRQAPGKGPFLAELDAPWIGALGVRFHLAMDGLSLPLLLLNWVVGLLAVGASWAEVQRRVGLYHASLLWTLASVAAVFLAMDLVLLYFAWELMLVPMYLLIGIWGHERRLYAAIQFFLFTQASGLLLLVSILGLSLAHRAATGQTTFDYPALLGTPLDAGLARGLMLGFFVAFAVKVPVVPLHTWLAEAHTQAPTGGSVLLAGVMLKTGGYGMMRFLVPLFPAAARELAPVFMTLGVAGILYGAWLALSQHDAKRLVAYTSVSHLGFVVLAVFAWNPIALQGALLEMICHGLSTSALFILVGLLHHRVHTRDLRALGGLWDPMPRFGAMTLFFALAALGLPGLGGFLAELLCLLGAWQASPTLAGLGALGLVGGAIYALWLVQRTVHGDVGPRRPPDLGVWETAMLGAAALALLWLGLAPQPLLDAASGAIGALLGAGGGA